MCFADCGITEELTKQNPNKILLFLESLNLVLKSKTPSSSCRSLSVIARDSCISEFSPELNFRGKIGGFGKWGVEQQIFEGQYGEGFLMHCGGHYAVQLFFYLSIFLQEGLKLSLDHLCPRYFQISLLFFFALLKNLYENPSNFYLLD